GYNIIRDSLCAPQELKQVGDLYDRVGEALDKGGVSAEAAYARPGVKSPRNKEYTVIQQKAAFYLMGFVI
ncbi:MAG: hypothetical protein PHD32_12025, partial [Eubacteriales bacterium]|nr:hypothetical protein [Eubacteriales bacterium]